MFFLKRLPHEASIIRFTGSSERAAHIGKSLQRIRSASLLIRNIERYFATWDLSQLKFLVLMMIEREPERESLRASEIAERLDVSKPVLHRTIQALIGDKMLQAQSDPLDKRAEQLFLTEKGHAILNQLLPGYFEIIEAHPWEGYTED